MQKQRGKLSIQHTEILLSDLFPVTFFHYTQRNRDLSSLHYHRCFEIGICLKGSGMFSVENQMLSFRQGDVSFIFPDRPHIAQSPNELPSRWVFIHADLDRLLPSSVMGKLWKHSHSLPGIVYAQDGKNMGELVRIVVHELENHEQDYQAVVKSLLNACVEILTRLDQKEQMASCAQIPGAYLAVSPALIYITQNYAEQIALKALAGACGLSATHFRTVFKRALGKSPMRYLGAFRIKMAKTLLHSTSLPIIDIAESVGYTTISSFNRAFKSETGRSPSEYRKQEA